MLRNRAVRMKLFIEFIGRVSICVDKREIFNFIGVNSSLFKFSCLTFDFVSQKWFGKVHLSILKLNFEQRCCRKACLVWLLSAGWFCWPAWGSGTSTSAPHPQTSQHRRYRTLRSSSERRTMWPTDAWRRTRSHLQRLDERDKPNRDHVSLRIWKRPTKRDNLVKCEGSWRSLTSAPKVTLTPRSFSPQPIKSLSGSDHSRSHMSPWSGTSLGRGSRRIWSIATRSGLKPPWQQKIFSSTAQEMNH